MGITFRKGTYCDVERFLSLVQRVREEMTKKEWFYLDAPEDVRSMVANGTMEFWLAVDGETTAAVFSIIIPGMDACNYGYDLGFSNEMLLQVINMDTVAVHPDYRGQGLQRKLMTIAESEILQQGSRILLCTIHPENQYSLQNAQRQGYAIQAKLEKYGSVRYVLRKDI